MLADQNRKRIPRRNLGVVKDVGGTGRNFTPEKAGRAVGGRERDAHRYTSRFSGMGETPATLTIPEMAAWMVLT
eukprot:1063692-Rhodomonas_salina.1